MIVASRIIAVTAALALAANAVTVSSDSGLVARSHHQHIAAEKRSAEVADANETVVDLDKKAVETWQDLEARGVPTKIGLAWNNGLDSHLKSFTSARTKYIYTWSPWCPSTAKGAGLQCCPMLWGDKHISAFQQQKRKGGKCLLGMNEVNVAGQAKMSVSHGVQLWNSYIRDMNKEGYYLVTPSVTSGQDGLDWLGGFFAKCGGSSKRCNANAIAVHYYGTSFGDFQKWMNRFHDAFGMDLWVTEFACQNFANRSKQCNADQIWAFVKQATEWMDKTPWIKAYFYFGMVADMYNVNHQNQMVDMNNKKPNALGRYYLHQ